MTILGVDVVCFFCLFSELLIFYHSLFLCSSFYFSVALFIYYIRYKQVVVNKVGNLLITFECIYCVGYQFDT